MKFLYLIFGICAIAVSIGKTLSVNFGISKYLSKKPYKGDLNSKSCVTYFENELYFVGISCSDRFRYNALQCIELH